MDKITPPVLSILLSNQPNYSGIIFQQLRDAFRDFQLQS